MADELIKLEVIGEARGKSGNELVLNCGDMQALGVMRLGFNKGHEELARRLYCRGMRITIQELTDEELQSEAAALPAQPQQHTVLGALLTTQGKEAVAVDQRYYVLEWYPTPRTAPRLYASPDNSVARFPDQSACVDFIEQQVKKYPQNVYVGLYLLANSPTCFYARGNEDRVVPEPSLTVLGPVWPDICNHGRELYIGTITADGGPVDIYEYVNDLKQHGLCLRHGERGEDYVGGWYPAYYQWRSIPAWDKALQVVEAKYRETGQYKHLVKQETL